MQDILEWRHRYQEDLKLFNVLGGEQWSIAVAAAEASVINC